MLIKFKKKASLGDRKKGGAREEEKAERREK